MKILILSNSSHGGWGYSTLGRNVASRLRQYGHDVRFLGMQTLGEAICDDQGTINYPSRFDGWCSDSLNSYIVAMDADVLISMIDLWIPQTFYIPDICKQTNIPWIAHVTINSKPIVGGLVENIKKADYIVAPSKFNLDVLTDAGFTNNTFYIAHGVDLNKFYPSHEYKEEMRKRFKLKDKFVLLSIMRNKGFQKNFPALFVGYRNFLERNPDAKKNSVLYILSDITEPEGTRLDVLRSTLGMNDDVKFIRCKFDPENEKRLIAVADDDSKNSFYHHPNFRFDELEMCKIYNMADVHISSSSGESVCLPVLESMACGIPQIGTNFSTFPEFITPSGAGLLVDVKAMVMQPTISSIALIDEKHMAECIERLYFNKTLREEMSVKAAQFAKNYDWDRIVKEGWIPLLKMLEQPKPCDYNTNLGV